MKKFINVDGNTAASNIAYKFSEVCAIYPITPSSTMAELADEWAQTGKLNVFDMPVKVEQMQSEAGAAGAVHGSLLAGALTTTFTASQGLLLMIPNMYKIAGELLPCVFHVSARALATHALSIFGDHSDVMQCRSTGFCMLCSSSVQEAQDIALISHLSTLETSLPFLHFFDGFRTSHEVQKIESIDENIIKKLVPFDKIQQFKNRALSPSNPFQCGTAQNPDVYFQNREASNNYYNQTYNVVENVMNKVSSAIGRNYAPFEYIGNPNAENVIVAMGSGCETVEETIKNFDNVGLLKVRLYRPFNSNAFVKALPKSAKIITVLDRTKESGSVYEPLALDVISALNENNVKNIKVLAGRYGLGGKEFDPSCVKAIIDNMKTQQKNHFTVGIQDDITNTSLPIDIDYENSDNCVQLKFYGLGGDGTVSANKNSIKIIGENTNKYTQGYFEYDSKKSGSLTISHLRISDNPIKSTYNITKANFIAIHNFNFVARYDILKDLKTNGTVLLNTACTVDKLNECLPVSFKTQLIKKHAKLYIINAQKIAQEIGLGNKINTIMQSAFFKISKVIDFDLAEKYMKEYAEKTYSKKGENIVKINFQAIEKGSQLISEADIQTLDNVNYLKTDNNKVEDKYFNEYIKPINQLQGNNLKVSSFSADGKVPTDTTKFEKRGIASRLPCWQTENCIQCGMCVAVCPHSAIKSKLVTSDSLNNAPNTFKSANTIGKPDSKYCLQISPLDCTGCGVCASVCPAKNKALIMNNASDLLDEQVENFKYFETLEKQPSTFNKYTMKGLQFEKSYFEYNYACAGCGETPYIKIATQLFGKNMIIANATGCSSIYGGSSPACPYSKDENGNGPAWANSLFEDNAEFGMGMSFAIETNKAKLAQLIKNALPTSNENLNTLLDNWLEKFECDNQTAKQIVNLLQKEDNSKYNEIVKLSDFLTKKSIWIIGGDGWAYDIGYGGLDHLLNSKQNVNVLVLDSEVYSNTGGQSSKATPRGSFAKFAFGGKQTKKKDLGMIAVASKNCYVASIGLGANVQQTINAFKEAEAFDGPSLIIAYSPCVNHGFNMENSQNEIKRAVASGYWSLYRYNPETDVFNLDSPAPTMDYEEFILGESRYSALLKKNPQQAKQLFDMAKQDALKRYDNLVSLANKSK